jgi:hypothetical protein
LLITVCSWLALAQIAAHQERTDSAVIAGGWFVAASLCCAGIVTGIVIIVRRVWRRLRAGSRRDAERRLEVALRMARVLQLGLLAGRQITPLTVWGLVLQRGETAHLDLPADFQPAAGAPTQSGRVIATDRRLLCEVADGWGSLWFGAVVGFYPDIDNQTVVVDLASRQRVHLTGGTALLIAVYVSFRLYGDEGLLNHPALQSLDRVVSPPTASAMSCYRQQPQGVKRPGWRVTSPTDR